LNQLNTYVLKKIVLVQKTVYKDYTVKTLQENAQHVNLVSDFKFNSQTIQYNTKVESFKKKSFYGLNQYAITNICGRVEITLNKQLSLYSVDRWLVLNKYLNSLVPANTSIKEKLLINLNYLFLIKTYRGWRHCFSLPTRGQRTWSNGWTNFNKKNYLRDYKFNSYKNGLGNASAEDIKNAFYLEQLNLLWKCQWEKEWTLAYKKRQAQLKKTRGFKRLEMSTLAKTNPNFIKSKKQTLIPIGFDGGYTKIYLRDTKQYNKKN